jgi:hypothetical protein
VEPSARGKGIGARLVEECVHFAKAAGYRRIMLWTREVLTDARKIYQAAGFERIDAEAGEESGRSSRRSGPATSDAAPMSLRGAACPGRGSRCERAGVRTARRRPTAGRGAPGTGRPAVR